ncbi:PTS sorbitol transporter subunit IIA [Suicoccus acidiformans]|uniref:PTS sorbitol transporter subunit IIA n=1 Tax=Suicoccus acidiformans TaxID=2036206 RepID=A0A347WIQ8_9LACT|nr:PTS glucitol/sorbitol transporter subunit IIA [Suicoccus acidiformans]AXY24965.1 PTS sorbitol transporter subunit IIA [Suicoccus acidiformans]
MSVYETKVVNIGSDAAMFKEENMIVLFGENAPADLADYTYNVEVTPVKETITTGMTLMIDSAEFIITAVGDVVEKNLNDLAHITIRFNGANEAELAGTLYVEGKEIPDISIGTMIVIK